MSLMFTLSVNELMRASNIYNVTTLNGDLNIRQIFMFRLLVIERKAIS